MHNFGRGHYFWDFIDKIFNATCRPFVDQEEFYSEYKQKYVYKCQSNVTPNRLVFNLISLFMGCQRDWKIVELSILKKRLFKVNQ